MAADGRSAAPRPTAPAADPVVEPAGVRVAEHQEVAPLLGRAAAEVAALKLRLAAVNHRADAAESLAEAAGDPGTPLEEEQAALELRLEQEHVAHRRRLDDELEQARAEADDVVAAARAEALEAVRAAAAELDVALGRAAGVGSVPPPSVRVERPRTVGPELGLGPELGPSLGPDQQAWPDPGESDRAPFPGPEVGDPIPLMVLVAAGVVLVLVVIVLLLVW